jgi:hypothetical protein
MPSITSVPTSNVENIIIAIPELYILNAIRPIITSAKIGIKNYCLLNMIIFLVYELKLFLYSKLT